MSTIYGLYLDGNLFNHIWVTVYETVISFSLATIIGTGIAIILWYSEFLYKVLDPYLTILNSLPKVALGPLLIIWIGSVIIFVIRNKVLITKIIVWKEIKDKLEKKLITEMQEAIKIYKERIKDLECQKKICHVVSELMNMQRLGKSPIELEEYLIGWSLRQLLSHEGDYPEAYSVAIYHCINSKVIMGGYLSNIIGDTIPNIYRKPIPRKADKYIEYCSFKCFENKEETSLILLARDEIKKTLKNPPPRINQYANKVFNISNKHRILLEIIAYDNTVFGHNDLNPKDYLEGILNEFGHLFLGTGRDIALEQYYA